MPTDAPKPPTTWATELSAMHRLRQIFDDLPPEAHARTYFWLGDSLGLAHVFPASHGPQRAQHENEVVTGMFQPPPGLVDMMRENLRQQMAEGEGIPNE